MASYQHNPNSNTVVHSTGHVLQGHGQTDRIYVCYEGWKGTSNNASFLLFFFYFCQIGHLYSFLCSPHYNKIIQRRDERRPNHCLCSSCARSTPHSRNEGGGGFSFSDIFPSYSLVKTLVFGHRGKAHCSTRLLIHFLRLLAIHALMC